MTEEISVLLSLAYLLLDQQRGEKKKSGSGQVVSGCGDEQ